LSRDPIPTWFFAVVVVRRGDHFLLVHECEDGQPWYLPAGRVEPGESLVAAARRETLEETGVPVEIEGVIRIEHTPQADFARLRVIFLARPLDDTPPKHTPDEESLEAAWVQLADLDRLSLRSEEVPGLLRHVAAGGPVYPVSVIQEEGASFP
jgi:phosphatase NudJ